MATRTARPLPDPIATSALRPPRPSGRYVRLFTLLALLGGAPLAPALAQDAPRDVADEAQYHFVRGNRLYREGRFEDALGHYYASNRLAPNRNVQFNVARCLEQLKLFEEAYRSWSALDAQVLPEAERATVKAAVDRLRPYLALIEIVSDPPGASIFLTRRDLGALGATPKRLAVPEGKTKVLLELAGHRPVEAEVDVVKGKELRIERTLERIYGEIEFRRLPTEAEIRRDLVDGEVLRRGPGKARLVPGRQVFFVTGAGWEPQRLEVEVRPDATVPVDVVLAPAVPPSGTLVVRANFDGALVRVDGREVGFSPAVIEGVLVGERRVEVSRDGRQAHTATVTIKRNDRTYLDVHLRRADPEVSAATKSLVRAEQAPGSISVLTADQIAAFGWTTLAQALGGVRGAFASDDRGYASLGFRGFSPPGDYTNRVLVLVDGHPINDVLTGQGYVGRDVDVDLANVERIEVVRGPGSILYGTGALFGVINVVTRRPAAGLHAGVDTRWGSLGETAARATVGGASGRFDAQVSAAVMKALGDRRYLHEDGAAALRADVEEARHVDLLARAGPVTLRAGWNEREKHVPTGAFQTRPEPGTTYTDRRLFAELRLDQAIGATRLAARAAYDQSTFEGLYKLTSAPDGTARNDVSDSFEAHGAVGELRLALPELLRQSLTVGAEAQAWLDLDLGDASLEAQRAAGATSELVLSGYVVDDWRIAERLRANLGLRFDHYKNSFGSTVNPRLALMGRPYDGGNSKLLLGRSFRAPSVYERFYNDGDVTQRSAGRLDPEQILSAEVEHAHALDDDLQLVGSLFANQVAGLIELGEGEDGKYVYANRSEDVRSYGAEAELRWEPGDGTSLTFAYSWQRVRALSLDGEALFPNAPTHLVALRVLRALMPGALRLGNEVLFDAGRPTRLGTRVEDAFIWNATLSGGLRAWRARYFLGAFNLLDVRGYGPGFPAGDELERSLTVPRYGRSVRAGLSWAW
jgi:outer membrane receptor protein involved in Fe transport